MLTADIAARERTSEVSTQNQERSIRWTAPEPGVVRQDAARRRVEVCIRACRSAVRRGERVVPEAIWDGLTVGDVVDVDGVGYTIGAGWRVRA